MLNGGLDLFFSWLAQGINHQFFLALGTLIVIDWITGVVRALKQKNFRSNVGLRGILAKISLILAYTAFSLANKLFFQLEWLSTFFELSIILYELTSIFENVSAVNPSLKEFFANILKTIKDTVGGNGKDALK